MAGDTDVMILDSEDPLAVAAVEAIHTGYVAALQRLLAEHPGLATARLGDYDGPSCDGMSRTLLHVVTDWPGHYPHGAATVAVLVAAGADVNARFTGPHTETPLHWAASSDDVEVSDALLAMRLGSARPHRHRARSGPEGRLAPRRGHPRG